MFNDYTNEIKTIMFKTDLMLNHFGFFIGLKTNTAIAEKEELWI